MTQCKHPFIIINDVQPKDLEALLNYMYKGDVNVLQDSLPSLIKAAEALKVKGLAVPDELPSENETNTSRKRNTFNSNNNSSKRSKTSEKISSFEAMVNDAEMSPPSSSLTESLSKDENDIPSKPKVQWLIFFFFSH